MVLHSGRALGLLLLVMCVQTLHGGSSRLPGHRVHPELDRCPIRGCSGDFMGQKVGAQVLICSADHELVRNAEGLYELVEPSDA